MENEDFKWIEQKFEGDKDRIELAPGMLNDNGSIAIELTGKDSPKTNSRCVSVDTISPAPDGRRKKRESFKGKTEQIKFRCTPFEKKLLKNRAKRCGLTLSEYFRRVAFDKKVTERLTEEEIIIYRMLMKFHNNFRSIGNMYKKRNPHLTEKVYWLADEMWEHLKKFRT